MEKKQILVTDDDRSMRKGLVYELTDLGYQVMEAQDGGEAIRLIQKNDFDLVISDLIMPNADGLEVYDAIQKHNPKTKCIIMTAFTDVEKAQDAEKRLKDNFIKKPFSIDLLSMRITHLLQSDK